MPKKPSPDVRRFDAELFLGHKGVAAIYVPFDPELDWGLAPTQQPTVRGKALAWLVWGTLQGKPFEGWIGFRYGNFFVIVEDAVQEALGVGPGDTLSFVLEPDREAMARATPAKKAVPRRPGMRRAVAPEGNTARVPPDPSPRKRSRRG